MRLKAAGHCLPINSVETAALAPPKLFPNRLQSIFPSGLSCSACLGIDRVTVLLQAAKLRRTMTEAGNKKQSNRIAHSAPGSVKVKSARKQKVVAEVE